MKSRERTVACNHSFASIVELGTGSQKKVAFISYGLGVLLYRQISNRPLARAHLCVRVGQLLRLIEYRTSIVPWERCGRALCISAQERPSRFILRTVSSSSGVHLSSDDFSAPDEVLGGLLPCQALILIFWQANDLRKGATQIEIETPSLLFSVMRFVKRPFLKSSKKRT
jgi:hypothetical protein